MKNVNTPLKILGIVLVAALFCTGVYFILDPLIRSAITSVVEVPICEAQIRQKLNIESNYGTITDYAISSLRLGMTHVEVEKTLANIGSIEVKHVAKGDEIYVRTCTNPLGNIKLYVQYSPDGLLEKIENAFSDDY